MLRNMAAFHQRLMNAAQKAADDIVNESKFWPDGLNAQQVKEAREQYGDNHLTGHQSDTILYRLKRAFINPFTMILLALTIISWITDVLMAGRYARNGTTVIIMLCMLLISGLVRFWQELRAKRVADRLTHLVASTVKVRRDGEWIELPAEELVVSDRVSLTAGDRVWCWQPASKRPMSGTTVSCCKRRSVYGLENTLDESVWHHGICRIEPGLLGCYGCCGADRGADECGVLVYAEEKRINQTKNGQSLRLQWLPCFLVIDNFLIDDFFNLVLDGVHHPDPTHLIRHLQPLGHTCFLRHLRDHRIQQVLCLYIGLVKIVVQLAGEQQSGIQPRPMFLQILHTHHTVLTQRIPRLNAEIWKVVVAKQGIVQAILIIMNLLRQFAHFVFPHFRIVHVYWVAGNHLCVCDHFLCSEIDHTTILERKQRNPNPFPIGIRFGFLKYGGA